ncbi:D-allose transporter substrate-binding protein [Leeia sp. TBRC 13508]|uniref:D-allose transporter substrate-binding protein n=1 Tax=Leeia speluncae TaxID=2884804 RepID=A0ABS8D9W8_9NEIS|nr:D-allose transporter substrate-binding protein [Leeia speluncae]MCB6184994.1 D-allose transporter substrate-binding protein [Leeia speluncae]
MNLKKIALMIAGSAALTMGSMGTAAAADYAVVLKTLASPYWVAMKDGVLAQAKKEGVQVDVFAANSEDDIAGQQRLMEDVINKKYKAVGVAPISPVNLVQQITSASKKGIYVVNMDEKVDMAQLKASGGKVEAFLSTDNMKIGEKAGQYILKKIGAAGGKVAIIEGKAGNSSGDARRDGVKKSLGTAKNVQIVASLPADWDRSKALDVATSVLQRNPDLKAFYAANDTMALGAQQAVKNAGKQGKVIVVGTDGVPEAVDSVKRGELEATVAQDAHALGAKSLEILVKKVKAKAPIKFDAAPEMVSIESKVITKN